MPGMHQVQEEPPRRHLTKIVFQNDLTKATIILNILTRKFDVEFTQEHR